MQASDTPRRQGEGTLPTRPFYGVASIIPKILFFLITQLIHVHEIPLRKSAEMAIHVPMHPKVLMSPPLLDIHVTASFLLLSVSFYLQYHIYDTLEKAL